MNKHEENRIKLVLLLLIPVLALTIVSVVVLGLHSVTKDSSKKSPVPQQIIKKQEVAKKAELKVTATCYHPTMGQCDSRPFETATQAIIDMRHPDKHRWIAISRDLLDKGFSMRDTVRVEGTWIYDGLWIIQDKMNKRFTNKIDFLITKGQRLGKWESVKITKHYTP